MQLHSMVFVFSFKKLFLKKWICMLLPWGVTKFFPPYLLACQWTWTSLSSRWWKVVHLAFCIDTVAAIVY